MSRCSIQLICPNFCFHDSIKWLTEIITVNPHLFRKKKKKIQSSVVWPGHSDLTMP